ncbi:MAG: hypothetical protein AAGE59_04770 [Cyanobacteria bacterium P01_F01_bin.86]
MAALIPTANTETDFATLCRWQPATWEEYCGYRDDPSNERLRLFFDDAAVLVMDMEWIWNGKELTTRASAIYSR